MNKNTKSQKTKFNPKAYFNKSGITVKALLCSTIVVTGVLFFFWTEVISAFIPSFPGTSRFEGTAFDGTKIKDYVFTEEYNRTIKKVLVSLSKKDTTLKYQHEVLKRLPKYSEIILLVPKSNLELIKTGLKNKSYADQVRLMPYNENPVNNGRFYLVFPEKDKLVQIDNGNHTVYQGSLWAQDLFEVVKKTDGTTTLLVSDVYKWFKSSGDKSSFKVVSDNAYLSCLESAGMEVIRSPVTFEGGNILTDTIKGQQIVFLGGNVLKATRTVSKSTTNSIPSNSQITDFIKNIFNADEVVIVSEDTLQPSSLMFHLDQAVIFLHNDTAGVTRIVNHHSDTNIANTEIKQVEIFLAKLRNTLKSLGYKIIDINISKKNLINHQQYVNAIPYIDAETGQRTILMPVFPSTQTDFETKLVKMNVTAFESLGYNVVQIPTQADRINGGVHCLVNVLE